jgi:hypothetical protein
VFHHHHNDDEPLAARIDRLMAGVFVRDDSERLAQLAPELAPAFVYISRGGVFDGAEGLSEAFSHYRHDDWLHTSLRRSSGVDVHHGYFRYSWQRVERDNIATEGGSFGQIDAHGLITHIVSFDGAVPGTDDQ